MANEQNILEGLNFKEELESYTKATEVSMSKIYANEPIVFNEHFFDSETGEQKIVEHHALPVTAKNIKQLRKLGDKLAAVRAEYQPKGKELLGIVKGFDATSLDSSTEQIEEMTKKLASFKEVQRKYEEKTESILLDMAVLVFSRTEKCDRESVANFLDIAQLQLFEYIAFGLSIPPNLLPGGQQKQHKNK